MATLMAEHRCCIIFICCLVIFFLWMDVQLYKRVQSSSFNASTTTANESLYSPFNGLSIKLIMMDHINNYILTPLAEIFNGVTCFSQTLYVITPNMISFMGICWAVLAAKFVTYDSFTLHRLSVFLFQIRNFFDALDGIVARSRMDIKQHLSLSNTSGYYVDGIADSIGFGAYLFGCYIYLKKNLPKQRHSHHYLPIQFQNEAASFNKLTHSSFFTQYMPAKLMLTSKKVLIVVLCFAVQLIISCALWNRYILAYHDLLETPSASPTHEEMVNEIKRSSILWVLMWFWRIANAQALMQMLLIAVYINKLWEFLTWIQNIGFLMLFTLGFFTEVHLNDVSSYLKHSI